MKKAIITIIIGLLLSSIAGVFWIGFHNNQSRAWQIACDHQGNYTFYGQDGEIFSAFESKDRNEAVAERDLLRHLREHPDTSLDDTVTLVESRKWNPCPNDNP